MKKDNKESKTLPPANRIYQAHCLEFLKGLPDECIDTIVTSPPYWGLRDYGISTYTIWDQDGIPCQHEWSIHDSKMPGGFCRHCDAWYGQLGLEPTIDLYIKHLCDIFDEVKRVLKNQGTCWVNLGDTYYTKSGSSFENDMLSKKNADEVRKTTGINTANLVRGRGLLPSKCLTQIPSRFALEMCNRGWILRNEIIWHKPNVMPSSVKDRFTVDFEKLFFFTKSKKYWFEPQYEQYSGPMNRWGGDQLKAKGKSTWDAGTGQGTYRERNMRPNPLGRNKRAVWRIPTKPYKEAHFATFPEALIETPIQAGCPKQGVVLDPFMGSGTVAVVSKKSGRNFIGVELNPDYIAIAQKRLQAMEKR